MIEDIQNVLKKLETLLKEYIPNYEDQLTPEGYFPDEPLPDLKSDERQNWMKPNAHSLRALKGMWNIAKRAEYTLENPVSTLVPIIRYFIGSSPVLDALKKLEELSRIEVLSVEDANAFLAYAKAELAKMPAETKGTPLEVAEQKALKTIQESMVKLADAQKEIAEQNKEEKQDNVWIKRKILAEAERAFLPVQALSITQKAIDPFLDTAAYSRQFIGWNTPSQHPMPPITDFLTHQLAECYLSIFQNINKDNKDSFSEIPNILLMGKIIDEFKKQLVEKLELAKQSVQRKIKSEEKDYKAKLDSEFSDHIPDSPVLSSFNSDNVSLDELKVQLETLSKEKTTLEKTKKELESFLKKWQSERADLKKWQSENPQKASDNKEALNNNKKSSVENKEGSADKPKVRVNDTLASLYDENIKIAEARMQEYETALTNVSNALSHMQRQYTERAQSNRGALLELIETQSKRIKELEEKKALLSKEGEEARISINHTLPDEYREEKAEIVVKIGTINQEIEGLTPKDLRKRRERVDKLLTDIANATVPAFEIDAKTIEQGFKDTGLDMKNVGTFETAIGYLEDHAEDSPLNQKLLKLQELRVREKKIKSTPT